MGCRECTAVPDTAVDHDLLVPGQFRSAKAQFLHRKKMRAADRACFVLRRGPYIEQEKVLPPVYFVPEVLRRDILEVL
jgi:hypothetical protein